MAKSTALRALQSPQLADQRVMAYGSTYMAELCLLSLWIATVSRVVTCAATVAATKTFIDAAGDELKLCEIFLDLCDFVYINLFVSQNGAR